MVPGTDTRGILVNKLFTASLISLLLLTLAAMLAAWAWAFRQLRDRKPLLPHGRPVEVPWGTGTVVLLLLTYLLVNILAVQGYVIFTGRPRQVPLSFSEQMILTALVNGALLFVIPILVLRTSGKGRNTWE